MFLSRSSGPARVEKSPELHRYAHPPDFPFSGPEGSVHSGRLLQRAGAFRSALLIVVLLFVGAVQGQFQSNDPSDATTSLPFTLNAADQITICTNGSETTGGTLAGATNTPTTIIPAALCGSFTAGSTSDVWYRIDVPASGDIRFRVTLKDGSSNPLTNGGMAAYLAASAAGPFQLIDCAVGGNLTNSLTNPTLEATCVPAGSKIYLRVWDEGVSSSTKTFSVCVQGQDWGDLATRRDIADTPCGVYATPTPATILSVGGALATFYTTFACNEAFPYDPSCGSYRGGDVWFRATVPASGSIRLIASQGLTASRRINRIGFAMYSAAGTCSDYSQFSEIACVSTTLTSTSEATLATIGCLTPGSTVYIRAYPTIESQSTSGSSRYGAFRLRVTNPAGTPGTIANNLPCTATSLSFGACPAYTSGLVTFNDNTACTAPGVPQPGCGTFSSTTSRDVWYQFVAPANGTVGIHVNGNTSSIPVFDAAAALYTAASGNCNGPLTLVDCDDDHGPGLGAYIIRTDLVPGNTYYVRVWGEGTSGSQTGIFYICLTNPEPDPGNCFYLLRMSYDGTGGSQTMRVAIGPDTTDYTTTMGEPNEFVLVEVPGGLTVTFIYYNTALTGGIWYTYDGAQLGEIPTWVYRGGGAVTGPSPGPAYSYTVNSCAPYASAREDCLGSRTICGPSAIVDTTFLDYDSGYRGYITDLTVENRGCLQNENRAGRWFIFRAQADGEVSFTLQGLLSPTEDIDFAIWDAGAQPVGLLPNVSPSICSPTSAPIRCSSARVAARTGLLPYLPNRTSEGTGGFGWLSALPVLQDHVYLLYVVNMDIPITSPPYPPIIRRQNFRRFSLQWTSLLNSSGVTDNTILDCTQLILPIELIAFDAWRNGEDAELGWSTATERNSDHFAVERSMDGITFKTIGHVAAAGTSVMRRDYGFTDEAPLLGTNYYRLKMVDQDHTVEYSDVKVVVFGSADRMVVFPNPAGPEIHLSYGPSQPSVVYVTVIDATGRVVHHQNWSETSDAGQITLDVSDLARGTYIIRSVDVKGEVISARFIKG